MPDVAAVKRELTRLAEGADDRPSAVVEAAASAVEDVELAAAFADEVGVERLRRAVERVDGRLLERTGQRALATFERFREGSRESEPSRNAFSLRMQSTNE